MKFARWHNLLNKNRTKLNDLDTNTNKTEEKYCGDATDRTENGDRDWHHDAQGGKRQTSNGHNQTLTASID